MTRHSKDTKKLHTNATSQSVADSKAQAGLANSQDKQCEGQFTVSGDTRLTAGGNFHLTGFGRFDGKYRIKQATHRLSRSTGYTTEIAFCKID